MERGEGAVFCYSVERLLTQHQGYDWDAIATACGSTKGAVSKRYSRLKLSLQQGDAPPKSPSKSVKSECTPTTTPKRKRSTAGKVKSTESGDGEDEDNLTPKRAKTTPKSKPRPKNGFRAGELKEAVEAVDVVKSEVEDDDVFADAREQFAAGFDMNVETELDEVCKFDLPPPSPFLFSAPLDHGTRTALTASVPAPSMFAEKFTHARELADVLLDRKTGLAEEYREEIEGMLGAFDERV